ncbi:MAG TPA: flagellar biosynthesis protein FlhB [Persephonella sp.]|uniref:Flagellar biosynthetic protein FlhB n=1 Tax=Persephonella marina (strain DSM 14350 / EX-H1) TaxID=123214 RepID=C0QP98_PERMH|nr:MULTISPECIES: flagellar biosynthesis protein FlhB [Persephonella]ACO03293.1 flagellar biosynthetic protein FlhB [Persephonella marina EX-H1]HCB69891.1 flagellar biosynthesis protein FlhB [Persephonella sp.]
MAKDPSKTEKATPRRRQKAREEGQVARSQDIPIAASLLIVAVMMFAYIPFSYNILTEYFHHTFSNPFHLIPDLNRGFIYESVKVLAILVLPFFLILLAIGVFSNVVQFGFLLSGKALVPKIDRLNPVSGLGRIFSMKTLFELVRNLLKLLFASVVAYFLLMKIISESFNMSYLPLNHEIYFLFKYIIMLILAFAVISIPIAIIDFIYRKWEHEENIKMSKHEIKEERKMYEGNPHVKAAIRKKQREIAMMRMMAELPKADVVITNPEHYAVALKYEKGKMAAPKVIAKGKNHIAQKIKEIAKKYDIPVVEDPPLARSLYSSCEIGDMIPENLYVAIAKILAKIYRRKAA